MALFRALDFTPVRFYGKISYSFYLLHMIGIAVVGYISGLVPFSLSDLPISVVAIYFTVVAVLVTTPAAYLSWRFVEMPFINLAKNSKCLRGSDLPAVS
jgi:peptidoglycan/LPS O-acetylase OafA/YrhL